MSLDFTKLLELATLAKDEASKITPGKYTAHNVASRKNLTLLQAEAQRLKKEITQAVKTKPTA